MVEEEPWEDLALSKAIAPDDEDDFSSFGVSAGSIPGNTDDEFNFCSCVPATSSSAALVEDDDEFSEFGVPACPPLSSAAAIDDDDDEFAEFAVSVPPSSSISDVMGAFDASPRAADEGSHDTFCDSSRHAAAPQPASCKSDSICERRLRHPELDAPPEEIAGKPEPIADGSYHVSSMHEASSASFEADFHCTTTNMKSTTPPLDQETIQKAFDADHITTDILQATDSPASACDMEPPSLTVEHFTVEEEKSDEESDVGGFSSSQRHASSTEHADVDVDDGFGDFAAPPNKESFASPADDEFGGFSEAMPGVEDAATDEDFGAFDDGAGGADFDSFASASAHAAFPSAPATVPIAPSASEVQLPAHSLDSDQAGFHQFVVEAMRQSLPEMRHQSLFEGSVPLQPLHRCLAQVDGHPSSAYWDVSLWMVSPASTASTWVWEGSHIENRFLKALALPGRSEVESSSLEQTAPALQHEMAKLAGNSWSSAESPAAEQAAHMWGEGPQTLDRKNLAPADGMAAPNEFFAGPLTVDTRAGGASSFALSDSPADDDFGGFGSFNASVAQPSSGDMLNIDPGPTDKFAAQRATAAHRLPMSSSSLEDDFSGFSATVPPPIVASGSSLLDLDFLGASMPSSNQPSTEYAGANIAQLGMADMLSSLDSLASPASVNPGTNVISSWLNTLPHFAYLFSDTLSIPAGHALT
ncbi:hypothetical protein AB1Y20_001341 [Prymnesium parvum]|uniref:Aftiphilin clathrin-binding box domain-containing protein n=1 Tax=Prymnesium parvum TaxID=97485 RepID=A0AB34K820_PRYPA